MADFQSNRTIQIDTLLGEDILFVSKFSGKEQISGLSRFEVELVSDTAHVPAKDIVGTNVTVLIKRSDGGDRFFNGFVARWAFCGRQKDSGKLRTHYRAEIVPWTWFLTKTTDCRIFQNMSVPQIVEDIFGEYGFSDYITAGLNGDYTKREYCVQYRESDFDFVSRLLEDEGIFYYFEHSEGHHTLMLCDGVDGSYDCVEREVDFPESTTSHDVPQILSWEHEYEFQTGRYSQTDYNFESPSLNLSTGEKSLIEQPKADKYEQYDYPGDYQSLNEGRRYTRLRMEEEETPYDIVIAESNCRSFGPGGKFELKGHYSDDEAGQVRLITTIEHHAQHRDSVDGIDEDSYHNRFTSIPAKTIFRPQRETPQPIVQGTQTAKVVGPSGELVHTDEYGRVKVQFHWDREGKNDENSSCWIRVSQDWAGEGYGSMYLPHIGHEVIVDFLEGNPDKPIITGRVYNGENKVPVTLPEGKYVSVVARDHYGNELIFDGSPGDEHIEMRSPHHESWLQLGRSVRSFTDSDEDTFIVGNTASAYVGTTAAVHLGTDATMRLGLDLNVTVGLSYAFSVAGAMSYGRGFNYSYFKGNQISNGAKHSYNSCDEDHVINGGNVLSLSGGGETKSKNSIVNLNDETLQISFGKKNSPTNNALGQKWVVVESVLLGMTVAGLEVGTAEASAKSQNIGMATAAASVHVPMAAAAAQSARSLWKKHKPVSHSNADADAMIEMDATGIKVESGEKHGLDIRKKGEKAGDVLLQSATGIRQIALKGEISLIADKEISMFAEAVTVMNAEFKTTNIHDLGSM